MTDMKPQMRKTPSYLKGLAETRARADADVQRLQKIHFMTKVARYEWVRNSVRRNLNFPDAQCHGQR